MFQFGKQHGGFDLGPRPFADLLCRPELMAFGIGSQSQAAGTNYVGASYFAERPIRFNRIVFGIQSKSNPFTGRISIYQSSDGLVSSAIPLIVTAAFSNLAAGRASVAVPLSRLESGIYWILWGQDSGAGTYSADVFNCGTSSVYNVDVATGEHPTSFATALAASTAPSSFDPLEGGADGVTGNANDNPLQIRLREV